MKKFFLLALAGAMLTACGGDNFYPVNRMTKGDPSQMDTLSYAIGMDMGRGISMQMGNLPLDLDAVAEGLDAGAFEKGKITHDSALVVLQGYFMGKFQERSRATAEKVAEMVAADSTYVAPKVDPTLFENDEERLTISNLLGLDLGTNLAKSGAPVQVVWLEKGFRDAYADQTDMTMEEAGKYLTDYSRVVAPAANKAENEEWLTKIGKQWGVKKTESGLLYKVDKKGDKDLMPTDDRDRVKVHYTGWNHKGQVFDSSYFKNKPKQVQEMMKMYNPEGYDQDKEAEFPLNGVIKGWGEGLKFVGKGGKITLWIPYDLAYGEHGGRSREIPGFEALKFEVEVIDVIPYEEPAPVQAPEVAVEDVVVEEM